MQQWRGTLCSSKVAEYALSGGILLGLMALAGCVMVFNRLGLRGSLSLSPWIGLGLLIISILVTWWGRRVMGQRNENPFAWRVLVGHVLFGAGIINVVIGSLLLIFR
jgi:hypothetical protein